MSPGKIARLFMAPAIFALFVSALLFGEGARERESQAYVESAQDTARESPVPEAPALPRIRFPPVPSDPARPEQSAAPAEPAEVSLPPPSPLETPGPRFAIIPARLRPGEPLTVAYANDFSGPGSRDIKAVLINSRGRRILAAPFFSYTLTDEGLEVKAAVLAVPSTVESGPFLARVEAGGRIIQDIPFIVEDREFISEVIPLDQKNTELRTVEDAQKTAESEELWRILSRPGTEIFDGSSFVPPVSSTRRTSFYGDRRVYRYIDGSEGSAVHAGVDYGVPLGTEVRACAGGRVALARFRIVTGNSVVVEHLPGLYSLYYHLETIDVEEGSIVKAGSILGRSGSTGLSTGPHLHWEIRAAGENADPDVFVTRAVLDKDEILRTLSTY